MYGCVLAKGIQISLEARGHEVKMNTGSVTPASFGWTGAGARLVGSKRNHHQGCAFAQGLLGRVGEKVAEISAGRGCSDYTELEGREGIEPLGICY